VLVRVPLGWAGKTNLCKQANPGETASKYDTRQKQTVEMRSPDASANVYLLMAGLAVAARYGFELKDGVKIADSTYVNVNIHKKENAKVLKTLATLPDSCAASAECLSRDRAIYEKNGVFSKAIVDGIIAELKSFNDSTLRAKVTKDKKAMAELVKTYFHCG
jgi:glutamine synthetase